MTWTRSPLMALDIESTGIDVESARIVTCCFGMSVEVGRWLPLSWLINPGVPIPPEATAVHGITDEMVKSGRDPKRALAVIKDHLEVAAADEVPIVGHGLVYDLTVIDRELHRHLGVSLPDGLICLDTLVLFRRFDFTTGGRTLSQLAARNGITFPAHDAEADALASLRLLHILAADNDLLPHVEPATLHELQKGWHAAQTLAAHYKRRANGQGNDTLPDTHWPIIPRRLNLEPAPERPSETRHGLADAPEVPGIS